MGESGYVDTPEYIKQKTDFRNAQKYSVAMRRTPVKGNPGMISRQ